MAKSLFKIDAGFYCGRTSDENEKPSYDADYSNVLWIFRGMPISDSEVNPITSSEIKPIMDSGACRSRVPRSSRS